MKRFRIILPAILLSVFTAPYACADGLSTPFSEIEVGMVKPGHVQVIHDSDGHGLRIKNLGSTTVRISMQVLVPQASQLRPGTLPIPDISWIRIQPNVVDLAGHEEKECEVLLNVPPKKSFRARYYQALIWSHGIPSQPHGVTISAGLLSKIRFRTEK